MKKLLLLIFIAMLSIAWAEDYQIYNNLGEKVSLDQMAKELQDYDVIFFGEWHDNQILHKLEIELLEKISIDRDIAVSMEMFERDVQPVVNEFLADKITEVVFIERSRAWDNYLTDYKPIVEFAKVHKLDLIAANVPRKYAAIVSRQGSDGWEKISEREFVAEKLNPLENLYKDKFNEVMAMNASVGHMMGAKLDVEKLYLAQVLKDDTMAESIYRYNQKNSKKQVIHYNGTFHSDQFLGTANKLGILNKKLSIAVIAPSSNEDSSLKFNQEMKILGNYIIVISM